MNTYDQIMARIKRLPVGIDDLGFGDELAWIESSVDRGKVDGQLYAVVDERLKDMEQALLHCPFLVPDISLGLGDGDFHILNTMDGQPVRIGHAPPSSNDVCHSVKFGQTGTGKSSDMANTAYQIAEKGVPTLLIDSQRFYRKVSCMRRTHCFLRFGHLRLNLWQAPKGVSQGQADQLINGEICDSFNLKFAEYELGEVIDQQRAQGIPNLNWTISLLKNKRFGSYSKRTQYRDSALLVLEMLRRTTGDIFSCSQGMDLEALLDNNLVIETDGHLPAIQAFVVRYFFVFFQLMSLRGD